MKIKVGHDFKIPEDAILIGDVGGYKFIDYKDSLCIQGNKTFNVSEAKIDRIGITPLSGEHLIHHKQSDIKDFFELDALTIYPSINYGDHFWLFTNDTDAYGFLSIIYDYKKQGLQEALDLKK